MKIRGVIIGAVLVFCLCFVSAECFSVDKIKVKVQEGGSVSESFSVTGESAGNVELNLIDLNGVRLSESSFYLGAGESKKIDVFFDSSLVSKGVYVGGVEILCSGKVFLLPIVFEVESKGYFFAPELEIPVNYQEVFAGENLLTHVKVNDITEAGLNSTKVNLEYLIYSMEGEVVGSWKEDFVLKGDAQRNERIPIPDSLPVGDYVVAVIVSHLDLIAISSESFSVIEKERGGFVLDDMTFLIVFGILFLVVLFVFFRYLIKDRDKLILDLKKYNAQELKGQREFLQEQTKVVRKKRPKVDVGREVKSKRKMLVEKQRERVKRVRGLKKKGDVVGMKKKIGEWKKKGYNTTLMDYKLSDLSPTEMKKIMNKWKKTEEYKKKK